MAGRSLAFGPAALLAHILQALWAIRALEVVNYFEHWGIERRNRRVLPDHSWDTHSRFTYYALTGLSRHADHHAFASRPYHASPQRELVAQWLDVHELIIAGSARLAVERGTAEELHEPSSSCGV